MPIEREELSEMFTDPKKIYCNRMGPVNKWHQGQITYCSREAGHAGEHEFHVKWLKVKPKEKVGRASVTDK